MADGTLKRARRHADAGEIHHRKEKWAEAREQYAEALAILGRGPLWWHSPKVRLQWAQYTATVLRMLGLTDLERGRPDLALATLEEALRRYGEISYEGSADTAKVLNDLGVAYERLGRYRESAQTLERADEIGRRGGQGPDDHAATLNNLALTYQASGDPERALQALDRAAALPGLSAAAARQLDEERQYHAILQGRFGLALVNLMEQFRDAPEDATATAYLAANIATAYTELQNTAEAKRWRRRAVVIRRRSQPGSMPLALDLYNLVVAFDGTEVPGEAERLLDEAIGIASVVAPHGAELALMRSVQVQRLLEADEPAEAVELGEKALADLEVSGRHASALRVPLAVAYFHSQKPGTAIELLERCRDDLEAISPLLPELRYVQAMLGSLQLDQGETARAAHSFDRAITVAESLRSGSADEPGLGRLFGSTQRAYHGRIHAAWLRLDDDPAEAEIAFRAAESFRARTLAETLSATDRAQPAGEAAQTLAELDQARRDLGSIHRRLEAGPDPRLHAERDALEEQAETLRVRLRALDPRAADREYPRPSSVAEVQAHLDESVTVAVYEVTDDGVYLFAVRRHDFLFTRIDADAEAIAAAVGEVVDACLGNQSDSPAEALRRLGEWLLRPIADQLGRLAVCAGEMLARLPFEALEINGVALAEQSTVWSIPSATILTHFGADRRERQPDRPFAGFAMPRTPGQVGLPATPREVRTAVEILGGDPPLVGDEVTLDAIRRSVRSARYVHFAVHGLISDVRPMFSGFPLNGEEFLHAYEMADLDLCADLVVCSACETAKGEARTGEGTVGLAYALFAAGARAVLLSRWPIADPVGPRVARELYRRLADGVAVADAVRQIRMELRNHYPRSWVWASFELVDLGAGSTT